MPTIEEWPVTELRRWDIETETASPSRWKVRDLCVAIVLIAVVLSEVRMVYVYDLIGADLFDSRRSSAAPLRVAWLVFALMWLAIRARSMTRAGRFFALAIILAVMQALQTLGGGIQPAYNVDLPARFNVLVWIAIFAFAIIGAFARAVDATAKLRTQDRRDAPGQ